MSGLAQRITKYFILAIFIKFKTYIQQQKSERFLLEHQHFSIRRPASTAHYQQHHHSLTGTLMMRDEV